MTWLWLWHHAAWVSGIATLAGGLVRETTDLIRKWRVLGSLPTQPPRTVPPRTVPPRTVPPMTALPPTAAESLRIAALREGLISPSPSTVGGTAVPDYPGIGLVDNRGVSCTMVNAQSPGPGWMEITSIGDRNRTWIWCGLNQRD